MIILVILIFSFLYVQQKAVQEPLVTNQNLTNLTKFFNLETPNPFYKIIVFDYKII
jgi:hypothetical protein